MKKALIAVSLAGLCLSQPAIAAAAERSVELVLDASGSMNGRLPDGKSKIEAAKAAVRQFAERIDDDVRISLRAYGHQRHRSRHDCKDTRLIVSFGAAADERGAIVDAMKGLKAQGYTPISYVLGLAAEDLKAEDATKRVIVLVSDGKETCEGDPCLVARKLAEADAGLTIHAIGFDVDYQARTQLQCIARAGRGSYRDASSAEDLATSLAEVATAETVEEEIVIVEPKEEVGRIRIVKPYFNEVVDAETGKKVATISDNHNDVELPPGIYSVRFGKSLWLKSIEIVAGETTVINPGRLRIIKPYFNEVLDPETGVEVEKATADHSEFPLPPGTYDVMFGKALWRGVKVREGETTVLDPARLKMVGPYFNEVRDPVTGNQVEKLTRDHFDIPLPPGEWDVDFGGGLIHRVVLKEGETTEIRPARIRIEKQGGFRYDLHDASGRRIITLTSGTNDIPLPAGKYTLDVGGRKVPLNLQWGKSLVLKVK